MGKKKMSCGRHTCPIICCPDRLNLGDGYHICTKVCNKKLECGCQCEQQCHRGSCRRCPNVSFDELRCHCGAAVVYPPVYCGTAPPECSEPCTRVHPCGHDVFHNCHSEAQCPPCPVLMEKRCNCGKSVRGAIPCFQQNVRCGALCDLQLFAVIIVTKLVTLVTASLKASNVLNRVHVRVRTVLTSV